MRTSRRCETDSKDNFLCACAVAKNVVIFVAAVAVVVVFVVVVADAFWLLGVSTPDIRNVGQFLVVSQSAINLRGKSEMENATATATTQCRHATVQQQQKQ